MAILQENIELRRLAMSVAGEPTLAKLEALVEASVEYGLKLAEQVDKPLEI